MIAALLLAVQGAAPGAEALALGERLARTGILATVAPLQAQKDIDELTETPGLSAAERQRIAAIGAQERDRALAGAMRVLTAAYAKRLTIAELRELVAQAESPAAVRRRAIEPAVIAETIAGLGEIDLQDRIATRMCAETKKLCDRE
ncbi:hypothetical protein [Sphingomonas sp. VNH70]|uniref:hypothetical protein n=1 Tax=Sphingomonas silueang TaxID=3156617 RepID=UPI0032B5F59C